MMDSYIEYKRENFPPDGLYLVYNNLDRDRNNFYWQILHHDGTKDNPNLPVKGLNHNKVSR